MELLSRDILILIVAYNIPGGPKHGTPRADKRSIDTLLLGIEVAVLGHSRLIYSCVVGLDLRDIKDLARGLCMLCGSWCPHNTVWIANLLCS